MSHPSSSPPVPEAPRLFGFEPTPGVVAVECAESEATLVRAVPRPDGSWSEERVTEQRPFRPWLLAAEDLRDRHASGPLRQAEWTRLQGGGLAWLVEFPSWRQFQEGRELLRVEGHPHHAYGQAVKQFLLRSGVTLFRGMDFTALRRFQFDLETSSLRPEEPGARILLIAASDNRGREWVFSGDDERRLVREFLEALAEADPDAVEGHNLFNFDLPYLAARARALGVRLVMGRDRSVLSFGRERNVPVGGISRPFTPARAWGRHLLDTLFAVQRFDVGRGELESHGLKEVAVHYGLAAEDRVYVDRGQIAELWERDPERVRRYALQDVEETRRLAELTLPTEFYQSQMVPESYQNAATGGSGEKINSLLIREYLRQGYGIPQIQPPVACPGGHTEIRATGVLRRVVKADVESLYPSLMLHYGIRPESDVLEVFLPMLRELTTRRLEAKARARRPGPEQAYWDGLQSSFKILINSFYGYLGATFHFNDYAAATRVTLTGQELVKRVAEELERTGSRVIEIDTDGVYFVPPEAVRTEAEERGYVEAVGRVLPEGIRLAHDGRYAAMVSLKVKNYVLVGHDGKRTYKGASLRSRADEAFGREFLARAVDALIEDDLPALSRAYEELCERIAEGRLPVEQFLRRERITEKTFRSEAKRKSREVARDTAVGETIRVYQRADGSLGLAEEYAGDEDRWHYLEKLYRFAERLQEALGDRFDEVFPRPSKKKLAAEMAGQMSLF